MVFYIRLRIKRGGKEAEMARTARVKENAAGTAHYHLMSRANDKRFLFEKDRVKDSLVDALKRAAESSGIGQCFAGSVPKGSGRVAVKAKPECCSEQNRNGAREPVKRASARDFASKMAIVES